MRYYEESVKREDKAGEPRSRNYQSKDEDINKAAEANSYEFSSAPNADEIGFLGMDDIDRIRREKLRHETR
jgi:hypothetical protein